MMDFVNDNNYDDDEDDCFYRANSNSFEDMDGRRHIVAETITQCPHNRLLFTLTGLVKLSADGNSVFAVLKEPFQWNALYSGKSFQRLYQALIQSKWVLYREIFPTYYKDQLVSQGLVAQDFATQETSVHFGIGKHGPTTTTKYNQQPISTSSNTCWFWENVKVSKAQYDHGINDVQIVIEIKNLVDIVRDYICLIDYHGHSMLTSSIIHNNNCFTREIHISLL
jgi:hypothetical protein